ncbi:hypothetical protein JYT28_01665, partial [Desulfobulbus sp. AH-315-M07]|nr:hypothetical protein [Desulfobulbus sp. AH-315-M07]
MLDKDGNPIFDVQFGDADAFQSAFAADIAGAKLYFGGVFLGTADFGGGVETAAVGAGTQSAFLVRYDMGGTFESVVKFPAEATSGAIVTQIAADSTGDVYVSGVFSGTADFGLGPVTAAFEDDSFVVSINSSGVTNWVKTFDGPIAPTLGLSG